ncbi:MAG TPA: phosphatase domain-containing protein [Phycisphaerae bacterium]|nr:phosphatase domain-containing protein [Phycisphaerae bacterium]
MRRNRLAACSLFIGIVLPCAAARAKPIIHLQDCIAAPDGTTTLVADLKKPTVFGIDRDIENLPVRFTCGGKEVGRIRSDNDGRAVLECKLPDSQGMAIEAAASVNGVEIRAEARVYRCKPDRVIVVVDIDDTISDTHFNDAWYGKEDRDSMPIRHSRETLVDVARDFQILYLTARPCSLLGKTQRWLATHGFPAAPVLVSYRKADLLDQGKFKQRQLKRLKGAWPNVLIGIGDRSRDARAYGGSGMLSLIVNRSGDFGPRSLAMADWNVLHAFFRNNRATLADPDQCRRLIAGERPRQRIARSNDDRKRDAAPPLLSETR